MIRHIPECKICGGALTPNEENSVGECSRCGAVTLITQSDSCSKLNRANHYRRLFEFDRAESLLDELIAEGAEDSEVYWAKVLCHYGVQYVASLENGWIPVCYRISDEPVTECSDYKKALYLAPFEAVSSFEGEAQRINDMQTLLHDKVNDSPDYDVFLCCKENDKKGEKTDDCLDAQEIYERLTALDYKVFYAPETLKDFDIVDSEAYTQAALQKTSIMLIFASKPETWRRGLLMHLWFSYLGIVQNDENKHLFPIIDISRMSIYDLPEELSEFSVFDKHENGFARELSETIEGILRPDSLTTPDAINTVTAANKENLIKRAYLFLEDKEWDNAAAYFEKILDIDIEDSRAYIGKMMVEYKLTDESKIATLPQTIDTDKNFIKALRFATPEQKVIYQGYAQAISGYIESEKKRIADERRRLTEEQRAVREAEAKRRERANLVERREAYNKRIAPLRKSLNEVKLELKKTLISPRKKAELKEQEEIIMKNISEIEEQYKDIW